MNMDLEKLEAGINYFTITHIQEKLTEILQEAPLYKNCHIEFPEFDDAMEILGISDKVGEPDQSEIKQYYESIPKFNWNVVSKFNERGTYSVTQQNRRDRSPFLNIIFPQTLSLFCSECNSIEAFNFDDASCLVGCDLLNLKDPKIQVFSISYQCQMCKSIPEIFLLRRKNLKISIDGRSPIQLVDVNRNLPKDQRKYIGKAKVAYNSGEILAALFFQRTFLEQYVREKTRDNETRELDKVFEAYKNMLTPEFNLGFPSLGAIYSYLSIDLHSANPSEETYLRANDEIDNHFMALRAFEKQGIITL